MKSGSWHSEAHPLNDEKQFFLIRHKLLGQPTPRQSQISLSAATTDIDNDQTDDQIMQGRTTLDTQPITHNDQLFVYYTHVKRFQTLKRDMHQVYEDMFGNTPTMHAKLIVGTRNRHDAKNELIRKRPKQTLLQNTITQIPNDCSHELRRFIEALFIAHAVTKLNTIGRLTHKGVWTLSRTSLDHSNRGAWCTKLVRSSSSGIRKF